MRPPSITHDGWDRHVPPAQNKAIKIENSLYRRVSRGEPLENLAPVIDRLFRMGGPEHRVKENIEHICQRLEACAEYRNMESEADLQQIRKQNPDAYDDSVADMHMLSISGEDSQHAA